MSKKTSDLCKIGRHGPWQAPEIFEYTKVRRFGTAIFQVLIQKCISCGYVRKVST